MSRSNTEVLLTQATNKYHHHDMMKRQVTNAMQHFRGLNLKLSSFVFNNGSEKELLNMDGTIPVNFKGSQYNIPVVIWLLDNHPYTPPMCFVKPTQTMHIKVSRHVDQNGKVYLPYLNEWSQGHSDVLSLIQVMITVFGEQPPVYSKSSAAPQPPNIMQQPYPPYPNPQQGYMRGPPTSQPTCYSPNYPSNNPPMPGYPARPPTSSYQSYPSANQQNYNSSYQGYQQPYPPNTYPPYPPTSSYPPFSNASTTNQSPNTPRNDVHSQNEERLLQLSAVENKLHQRLGETFSQMQAEIEVLKKTRTDLTNGKTRLSDILQKLKTEHEQLDHNIRILKEKDSELEGVLQTMNSDNEIDIDEAVTTTAPLYKQLLQLYAEENATQDAIYYLGEGLRREVIDLDVFLKNVRELSRKQFMLRALMQKCREKAGLPF